MSDTRKLALELHEIRQLALGHATNPQFGNSSVDGEGLSFRDGDGHEIGRIGGDEGNGLEIRYVDAPKPMPPTAPVATGDANLIRVEWDGGWVRIEGGTPVRDLDAIDAPAVDRVEVHVSMDENFVPDPVLSFAGVLPVTQEGGAHTVGPLAEAGDYYVVLMARGKDGQYSAPSERTHVVTTVGLMENELFDLALRADEARESADGKNTVHYGEEPEAPEGGFSEGDLWFDTTEDPETGFRKNTPHLWDPSANDGEGGWVSAADSRVDAIRDAQDALRDDVERIVTDGAGATTYWLPTEPDETTAPPPKSGDLWFNTADGNKLSRHDGQGWVSAADERIQTIQDAQDDLAAEVATVRTSVDGKNRITQSVDAPPTQYDGAVGDRWERMSSMGSGGSLISNWRWNGDVWVSTIISDAVLGNVDAAKIGTGYLDAARIEAGSITADMLMIGDFENRFYDPFFEHPDGYAPWEVVDSGIEKWGAGRQRGSYLENSRFKVYEGETLAFSLTREDVVGSGGRLTMYLRYFNAQGGQVGSWGMINIDAPGVGSATRETPAGASSAIVGFYTQADMPETTRVRVTGVQIRRQVGATLIENGAITTEKISVGAITAESGVVESLDAGDITVGELEAARIGAKTITADKILSGTATNLIPGVESWAESNAGWTEFGWNAGDGFLTTTGENLLYTDEPFFVPGGEYMLEGRITSSGGTGRAYVALYSEEWPDTGESGYRYGLTDFNGDASDVFVMPEGGANCTLRIITGYRGSLGTSDTSWIARISLRSRAGATLIQNGAVTTEKIAVGAITAESGIIGSLDAGVITTGELRGELIRAQSIAGESLAVDAIDGKTITGATIRTSSAGARVELDADGLRQYNLAGQPIVDMTGGNVTVMGALYSGQQGFSRVQIDNQLWPGGQYVPRDDGSMAQAIGAGMRVGRDAYHSVDVFHGEYDELNGTVGEASVIRGPGTTAANALYQTNSGKAWWRSTLNDERRVDMSILPERSVFQYTSHRGGSTYASTAQRAWVNGSFTAGHHQTWATASGHSDSVQMDVGQPDGLTRQGMLFQVKRTGVDGDGLISLSNAATRLAYGGSVVSLSRTTFGNNRVVLTGDSFQLSGISTGTGATNASISSSGYITRTSSTRRLKLAGEPVERRYGDTAFDDALLSVPAVTWFDKGDAERLSDYKTAVENDEWPDVEPDMISPLRRIPGVFAEDVDDAGLSDFVEYDEGGRPSGVFYDRMGVALIPVVRRLRDRVNELERMMREMANA